MFRDNDPGNAEHHEGDRVRAFRGLETMIPQTLPVPVVRSRPPSLKSLGVPRVSKRQHRSYEGT